MTRSAKTPRATAPSAGPVIVVDDDPDCRDMLVEALERVDVRAIACASAADALVAAAAELPAVVVTDVHLRGMDGAALARELRAREPCPVLLAMTGDTAVDADVWRAFDALITKPASPLEVAAMVVRHVRGPHARRARE